MTYKFLYGILVLILLFEISKMFSSNFCEGFTSSSGSNILTNSETDDTFSKVVNDNEEILLVTQDPNGTRRTSSDYIKTTLNKWVKIYVKSVKDGQETLVSDFSPIQIKSLVSKTLNLLGNNRFLIPSTSTTIKYYIKFLDSESYKYEKNATERKNALRFKYSNCLIENNALSRNQAASKCKSILS